MFGQKQVKEEIEKIIKEFEKAGASEWDAIKIIKTLEYQKLSKKKLQNLAFEELKKINPKAAQIFLSFQKMKVFTSKENLEPFDRGNITKSLLKETNVSKTIAEKISSEVEAKLKDLNPFHLTTALIRDMAAVKLVEFEQTKTYYQYSRLGMPVFDVEKKQQARKKISSEILRQFNLLKTVPLKAKELHFKKKIHVFGIPDFSTRPFASCIAPKTQSANITGTFIELQEIIIKNRHASSIMPSITGINHCFGVPLEKKTKHTIIKTALKALAFFSQLYSLRKKKLKPVVSLELFADEQNSLSVKQKEKSLEFAAAFAKAFQKTDNAEFELGISIDSEYKVKILKNSKKEFKIFNCFNEKTFPFTEKHAGRTQTLNQMCALNLESFFDKKNAVFSDSLQAACKTIQETFNEKEKKTGTGSLHENILAINWFDSCFEKNKQETLKTLDEIKKQFKENTLFYLDTEKIVEPKQFQANLCAQSLGEIKGFFNSGILSCSFSPRQETLT